MPPSPGYKQGDKVNIVVLTGSREGKNLCDKGCIRLGVWYRDIDIITLPIFKKLGLWKV